MRSGALSDAVFLAGGATLLLALLCCVLAVPLVRGKVGMNSLYGVRFRKSFASLDNWYKINRYGGKAMIGWAIPMALAGCALAAASRFIPPDAPSTGGWVLLASLTGIPFVLGAVVQTLRWSRNLPG